MLDQTKEIQVEIRTWAHTDLPLLHRLNAPEMLDHLGGPETEEQVLNRHQRYVEIEGKGQGIAAKAGELAIANAAVEKKRRHIHAFPSIDNLASNAICRKLGFQLVEECSFEYPPGNFIRCNDWRLDLGT
ncbi:GNAT family N-acetyltransferase [Cohnella terricola]|uniref:GNAT family N-acetyltransferase n=1 Tax=Cohnella terricola TaxID=1289167 RepID=A0A559J9Z0_9BACL|nr:GNAT family N-acetyltransferase [Cohnella terricola]TVX96681.1 GNAT family N-acetyltransferase [Cohnella terricola]